MTILEALSEGRRFLARKKVGTPFLDASLLLSAAAGLSKERIFAGFGDPVDAAVYARYQSMLMNRGSGVPVAYIRGSKEFYSLSFHVHPGVFIPRPDTETMVSAAIDELRRKSRIEARVSVHDVCTGSGCVAIAVKHEIPDLRVSCSDICGEALRTCRANSERLLGEALPTFRSDLFSKVPGSFDVITGNPPYLTDGAVDRMRAAGWPEPEIALRGGPDGLRCARQLIRQARSRLRSGGVLFMEADPDEMVELRSAMDTTGFHSVNILDDLSGDPGRRPMGRQPAPRSEACQRRAVFYSSPRRC